MKLDELEFRGCFTDRISDWYDSDEVKGTISTIEFFEGNPSESALTACRVFVGDREYYYVGAGLTLRDSIEKAYNEWRRGKGRLRKGRFKKDLMDVR